jgi:hypothetical protein
MSDHNHEMSVGTGGAVCKHCGPAYTLNDEQVEALVNAALGLGKENALAINQWMAEWAHIQTAIGYPTELGLALNKFAEAFPELDDS